MSEEEEAFYEILAQHKNAIQDYALIKEIVQEVTAAVKKNLQIDWHKKPDAKAQILLSVKRVLMRKGVNQELQEILGEIMEQAEGEIQRMVGCGSVIYFLKDMTIIETTELANLQSFVNRFKTKEKDLLDFRIMHEIPMQRNFLNSFKQLEQVALKLIEHEAPGFNLFHIININHLEARVHTPFLVELLNPKSTHRQNRLFFDAFIKHLFPSIKEQSISNIRVAKEVSDYENGRMDILITYEENRAPRAVIIENKIYHHDEKQQLTRYHRYLVNTLRLQQGQYHLVYLTPGRAKPTEESINESLYNTLKSTNSITEWGYLHDVKPVLEATLSFIKAPVVVYTLQQYIQSIESL